MSEHTEAARAWLAQDPDPVTRAELTDILDRGDRQALADRFDGKLEFGTAGLRGELGAGPNRMNRVTVQRTAAGLGDWLGPGRTVVIGYDARHYSHTFATDTAAILTGAGLRALLLPGPLPTPVLAFAVRHLSADAGVMVTASHNPPRDNGYKVYIGRGDAVPGSQIVPPVDAAIAAAIDAVGPITDRPRGDGWQVLGDEVLQAYLARLESLPLGPARDITVAYTPLHGVGRDTLLAAFDRAGFPAPAVVAEQGDPDPDFPTVAFPNPEEPGAMDLALALGERTGAGLVIANDPDADRCAVACGGTPLTGDELGGLLAEHVLAGTSGGDRVVATTIVSSSLLGTIAAAHGVRCVETLTGFKWISRADGGIGRLVFGYEEALGYCVAGDDGPPVRDKDGIGAALAVAAMAARAAGQGRTLRDLLDDQARRYGLHATRQLSFRVRDLALIAVAMRRLRAEPPAVIAGQPVTTADDLSAGLAGLPPSDVVRYRLADGARVVVRPSGTEPKLKVYLEVVLDAPDPPAARTAANHRLDTLADAVTALLALPTG